MVTISRAGSAPALTNVGIEVLSEAEIQILLSTVKAECQAGLIKGEEA